MDTCIVCVWKKQMAQVSIDLVAGRKRNKRKARNKAEKGSEKSDEAQESKT